MTGVLFGLAPAFQATRVELNTALKDVSGSLSRRGQRLGLGGILVSAQVALTVMLLISAGVFIRSLRNLWQVDAGFARDNVLVLKLEPIGSDRNQGDGLANRYQDLLERVEAIPGVRRASLVGYSPITRPEWLMTGQRPEWKSSVSAKGSFVRPGEEIDVPWMQVYPNSFETLGIPLLAGRDFTPLDSRPSQRVTIIPAAILHL